MSLHTSPVHDVAQVVSKLTHRDHAIIALVGDHGVFTTNQIHRIYFTSLKRTQSRLLALYRLGLLTRFRTRLARGSEQWHWVLAHLGARLHAAATGRPTPRRATVDDTLMRLSSHPTLAHTLGVNDFFVRILAACRSHTDAALTDWANEADTAADAGRRIRPDASATYRESGCHASFWFEFDRGTETLTTLADKADRYRDATVLTEPRPVLFALPNLTREAHLHDYLDGRFLPFPLATTHTAIAADPTAAVWRVLHRTNRVRLIAIQPQA